MLMLNKIGLFLLLFFLVSCNKNLIHLKQEVFIFEYGENIPMNVNAYVSENNVDNAKLDFNFDIDTVIPIGEYEGYITTNNQKLNFKIKIIDTKKPKFSSFTDEIVLKINSNIHDVIKHFVAIDEVGNQKLKASMWVSGYIDFNQEGEYVVEMYCQDQHKNRLSRKCKVIIQKPSLPFQTQNSLLLNDNNRTDDIDSSTDNNQPEETIKEDDTILNSFTYKLPISYVDEFGVHYEYYWNENEAIERFNELTDVRYHKCYFEDYETSYYEVIWYS